MTRIAICGFGNIGRVHLVNLRALRGCEVSGVYDVDPAARHNAALENNIRVYESEDELWNDCSWQALVVATPTGSHLKWTTGALARGRHVFVEKPLASTLGDSAALVAAAASYPNLCVQVGFCERFNPQYMEAARAVRAGLLGPLRAIDASRVAPLELGDPNWHLGVLDTAVHNLDLILFLYGQMPATVRAAGTQIYDEPAMLHTVTTVLTFADGALATDRITWLKGPGHPLARCARSRMSIYGAVGAFDIDLASRPSWLLTGERFQGIDSVIVGAPEYYSCLKLQFDYFLQSVEEGKPSAVTAGSAHQTGCLALAAAESLKTGKTVRL